MEGKHSIVLLGLNSVSIDLWTLIFTILRFFSPLISWNKLAIWAGVGYFPSPGQLGSDDTPAGQVGSGQLASPKGKPCLKKKVF